MIALRSKVLPPAVCGDECTFVAYLFAVHAFIHWSVARCNATVFYVHQLVDRKENIYNIFIYSYITKKKKL